MMHIAIRQEPNGSLYMDKYFFNRYNDSDLNRYGYTKVSVKDECFDDFELDDFNNDLTFNEEKYNARIKKQQQEKTVAEYENAIVNKIRKKYNLNQELAILRQKDSKPEEFYEYNNYVELCKAEVKAKFNL